MTNNRRPKASFDSLELRGSFTESETLALVETQRRASRDALVVGVVLALLGVVLFLLGIAGSLTWSLQAFGFDSKLVDASPGAVMVVAGVIVMVLNRFRAVIIRSAQRRG
jgi:hypothetical protein